MASLEKLLLSLFSADELRRFLRYLPGGEMIMGNLPGPNASPASLAGEAVALLARAGLIDASFWARLLAERPRRQADIEQARRDVEGAGGSAVTIAVAGPGCTVLLVSASPDTQVRLRVDSEFRDVIVRMKAVKYRDRFNFVQLQAARFDDLRTALLEHQPQVLHISAHGEADGSLLFEGRAGEPQPVTRKQFTKLLAAVEGLRLVVLNACHSQVIAEKLPELGGVAIGMSNAVKDHAAIEFAVAFYEALGFGRSVDAAFKLGLAGLDDRDDEVPRLFPPVDQDPERRRAASLITP